MTAVLANDLIVDRLAIENGIRLRLLQEEMNRAILFNPWIWAPDPLIHSLRWLEAERRGRRGIRVTRSR